MCCRRRKWGSPWSEVHSAFWLLGIAVLAWRHWWWPGILVLVAMSTVLEGFLRARAAGADPPPAPEPEVAARPEPVPPEPESAAHPGTCPHCGAAVHRTPMGEGGTAPCPYCGQELTA